MRNQWLLLLFLIDYSVWTCVVSDDILKSVAIDEVLRWVVSALVLKFVVSYVVLSCVVVSKEHTTLEQYEQAIHLLLYYGICLSTSVWFRRRLLKDVYFYQTLNGKTETGQWKGVITLRKTLEKATAHETVCSVYRKKKKIVGLKLGLPLVDLVL